MFSSVVALSKFTSMSLSTLRTTTTTMKGVSREKSPIIILERDNANESTWRASASAYMKAKGAAHLMLKLFNIPDRFSAPGLLDMPPARELAEESTVVTVADVTPASARAQDAEEKSTSGEASESAEAGPVMIKQEPVRLAPAVHDELEALIREYSDEANFTEHERAMLRANVVFIDPRLKKQESESKAKVRWECWRVLTNSVPHHRHLIETEGDIHALMEVVCKRTHYTILLPARNLSKLYKLQYSSHRGVQELINVCRKVIQKAKDIGQPDTAHPLIVTGSLLECLNATKLFENEVLSIQRDYATKQVEFEAIAARLLTVENDLRVAGKLRGAPQNPRAMVTYKIDHKFKKGDYKGKSYDKGNRKYNASGKGDKKQHSVRTSIKCWNCEGPHFARDCPDAAAVRAHSALVPSAPNPTSLATPIAHVAVAGCGLGPQAARVQVKYRKEVCCEQERSTGSGRSGPPRPGHCGEEEGPCEFDRDSILRREHLSKHCKSFLVFVIQTQSPIARRNI